jgi:hypothetical protein
VLYLFGGAVLSECIDVLLLIHYDENVLACGIWDVPFNHIVVKYNQTEKNKI